MSETGTPETEHALHGVWYRERNELRNRIKEWQALSDSDLRLRMGEMSAQEIRSLRAVLNAILKEKK